jgi:hypothetical protein
MSSTKVFILDVDNKFNNNLFPIIINDREIIYTEIVEYDVDRVLRSQYSLEFVLHRMFSSHPCRHTNYLDSDVVVIPIYLFLSAWKTKYFYDVMEVVKCIQEIQDKVDRIIKDGKKVLLFYSDVMWEDERCFLNYFEFDPNVFFVCYEDVLSSNKQIPVPFCTHIKSNPVKYHIPNKSNKTHLISYVGRYRPETELFENINQFNTDKVKDNRWISINDQNLYEKIDQIYLNSHFSLQPYGDKKSRKGFYHSLLMGCVPVVFENNYQIYEKIFEGLVNLQDICIVLSFDDKDRYTEILLGEIQNIPDKITNIEKIKHLLLYDETDPSIVDYILNHMN